MKIAEVKRRVSRTEAGLQKFVGRPEASRVVRGQEPRGDGDAPEHVAGRDLQERQRPAVRDPRNRQKGERTRLGRHHRKEDDEPRKIAPPEEVLLAAARAPPQPGPPRRHPAEIHDEDDEIDGTQRSRSRIEVATASCTARRSAMCFWFARVGFTRFVSSTTNRSSSGVHPDARPREPGVPERRFTEVVAGRGAPGRRVPPQRAAGCGVRPRVGPSHELRDDLRRRRSEAR